MILINMNCPHCSVHGRVPKTLINVRLLCKKCQEPFHMNLEGIAIAGDPPPPPGSEKTEDASHKDDPGLIVDLWIAKIAKVFKMIGAVALAVAGCAALMMLYTNFKPNSLIGRAGEVSEAILQDDIAKFNTFAYGNTGIDLFEWYGSMRPKLDDVRKRVPAADMGFIPKMMKENSEEKTAELTLRFGDKTDLSRREISSDEELTGQTAAYIDVHTYWKRDNFGRWWIEGSETLRGPAGETKKEGPGSTEPGSTEPKS